MELDPKAKLAFEEVNLEQMKRERSAKLLAKARSSSDLWGAVTMLVIVIVYAALGESRYKLDLTFIALISMIGCESALANRRIKALIAYLESESIIKAQSRCLFLTAGNWNYRREEGVKPRNRDEAAKRRRRRTENDAQGVTASNDLIWKLDMLNTSMDYLVARAKGEPRSVPPTPIAKQIAKVYGQ